MYVSYTLAALLFGRLALVCWLLTGWPLEGVLVAAGLLFLPFVPAIFRYSRVIWMHLDRALDPGD